MAKGGSFVVLFAPGRMTAGACKGSSKAVNVFMPFAVTWLLANLQPSIIYFAIMGVTLVAAVITIAIGPETKSQRLG